MPMALRANSYNSSGSSRSNIANGNDIGRGCVTDAMVVALKCATIPKTPVASEEIAEVMGGKPRQQKA